MRLIDAEKVTKRLYNDGKALDRKNGSEEFVFGIETALEIVHSEPTVYAEPVVHAHWEVAIGYDPRKAFQCSNCFKMNFQMDEYCPHCGAKMDEEA